VFKTPGRGAEINVNAPGSQMLVIDADKEPGLGEP
jgi:hypothetical protein